MEDTSTSRFWQQRAAADPLGRTADELRAQWAARTPIRPPGGASGIGYETTDEMPPDIVTVLPAGLWPQQRGTGS